MHAITRVGVTWGSNKMMGVTIFFWKKFDHLFQSSPLKVVLSLLLPTSFIQCFFLNPATKKINFSRYHPLEGVTRGGRPSARLHPPLRLTPLGYGIRPPQNML